MSTGVKSSARTNDVSLPFAFCAVIDVVGITFVPLGLVKSWKYESFAPIGSSPSRANSSAMILPALTHCGEPASRPSNASLARFFTRAFNSARVISGGGSSSGPAADGAGTPQQSKLTSSSGMRRAIPR